MQHVGRLACLRYIADDGFERATSSMVSNIADTSVFCEYRI